MKRVLFLSALAMTSLGIWVVPARAEVGYVGIGFTQIKQTNTCVGCDSVWDGEKFNTFEVKVGGMINPYFAVEGRVAGPKDVTNHDVKGKLQTSYGIHAKGIYPFNDVFSVYGTVGASRIAMKYDNVSYDESKTALVYGAGITIRPDKSFSVDVGYDYRGKLDNGRGDDLKFSSFGVGFNYHF